MNRKLLSGILLIIFMGCFACQGTSTKQQSAAIAENIQSKENIVVYYFHGKQRCKTCIAVGDLSKKTVETAYTSNPKVKFVEINTSEKENDSLVEKYQVTWNALIIAKGGDKIDITEQSFANAIENPDALAGLIKKEVDKRLQ